MRTAATIGFLLLLGVGPGPAQAAYTNFEASHVHPIALTSSGGQLLAVNTPDALLEVLDVGPTGDLTPAAAIPVGLEPVSVVVRAVAPGVDEAWVVNHLSSSVSIVDLSLGTVVRTLHVGPEPTDVAFAGGKAFVALSIEDRVKVYDLANLDAAPTVLPIDGREVRALDVAADGASVYAVVLRSGNRTSVVNANIAHLNTDPGVQQRLDALGLRGMECEGAPGGAPPAPYPPLPAGIVRNPALPLPAPPFNTLPVKVAVIVRWNESTDEWEDESGTTWTHCLPFRPSDRDLFRIDAAPPHAITAVRGLGTSLFEVSVRPDGKVFVPHTDARNFVPVADHATQGSGRFEHAEGIRGRVVDNRLAIFDPDADPAAALTLVDLNGHVDRSTPTGTTAERNAGVSQPGMLVWNADGSRGYLTAIGSRKVFEVDGACTSGSCIFGPDRANPRHVVTGEGPTGVALREDLDRLYVLNRISHSITTVEASTLTVRNELPLHDPSAFSTREGRRFLYDAIDTSGHGDSSCASCHVSGDLDGLVWELGNPEGDFVPYNGVDDNVRFITLGGVPCTPGSQGCSARQGFDPQKGPMATQTFRGMLEPLHWRGDRPTLLDFNGAFVDLLGAPNIGTTAQPRGLGTADMARFREFALGIAFPPNPYRGVTDDLPDADVQVPGMLLPGNPADGEDDFDNTSTDGGGPCRLCHQHPFGAAGGKLGGVLPTAPTSADATALFNGNLDLSVHSDLEVPHLRNMHEKFGPRWADPLSTEPPESAGSSGYIHDGSLPDLYRFLAASVFTVDSQQIRDLVAFMFHFPTGTRPAVGRQVTFEPGPIGTGADESLLSDLIGVGDRSDPGRHCELVASTLEAGRNRRYRLAGGLWATDVAGEPATTLTALREGASRPLTFTCAPLQSGERLGGNRDEDAVLDGDDCAPGDADTWRLPAYTDSLRVDDAGLTRLDWADTSSVAGPSLGYEVLGTTLSALRATGIDAVSCVAGDLPAATFDDPGPDPPPGDGRVYLVRGVNPCGRADLGAGRESLGSALCP